MTWYQELANADNEIRLRFVDSQGNTFGPYTVTWPDEPIRDTRPDGWIVAPDCKQRAASAVAAAAAEGNTQQALTMLASIVVGDVEFGVP